MSRAAMSQQYAESELRKRPSVINTGANPIQRFWRQKTALADITLGFYLLSMGSCMLTNDLLLRGGANVLSVSGIGRLILASGSLVVGATLGFHKAKESLTSYGDQWLPRGAKLAPESRDDELAQEQQTFKAGTVAGLTLLTVTNAFAMVGSSWQEQLCQTLLTATLLTVTTRVVNQQQEKQLDKQFKIP